jgi:hypothetical protein
MSGDQDVTQPHTAAPTGDEETRSVWRPSHHMKSNGEAKYVIGIGMLPKRYKGRVHALAKTHLVLQAKSHR